MRNILRSITFAVAASFGLGAVAQNVVTVTGTVSPCVGVSYPVHIMTNTVPPLDTTVYTGANCQYSFTFYPVPTQGVVTVETSCDGGITWVSATGAWNPFFGTVIIDLACNGGNPCDACFTMANTQPWTIQYTNCSSGGTPPYSYAWVFNNGSTSSLANPTETVSAPGLAITCLLLTDALGCESYECDSFLVDTNGYIDNSFLPCVACVDAVPATNGPAGPQIPWTVLANNCSSGGTPTINYTISWGDNTTGGPNPHVYTNPGTYNVCILMTDGIGCTSVSCDSVTIDGDGNVDPVITSPCEAGFWVMQGYETDSLNPGTAVPIPNELWIWNLSSGGNGNFQFVWSWGDGTPNSTEPYPSHVYANGGPYLLCLTITDISGCTDTACDSVSVDGNGFYTGMATNPEANGNGARNGFTVNVLNELPATGIDDRPAVENTLAWPNPVEDVLNLRFNTTLTGNLPMTIIDMNGRAVRSEQVMISAGGNNLQVPVSDLAPGLYMMRFGNDAKAVAFRFVKR